MVFRGLDFFLRSNFRYTRLKLLLQTLRKLHAIAIVLIVCILHLLQLFQKHLIGYHCLIYLFVLLMLHLTTLRHLPLELHGLLLLSVLGLVLILLICVALNTFLGNGVRFTKIRKVLLSLHR